MKDSDAKNFARTTDQQIELVARCFQALSDPTRLKVLRALKGGQRSVHDLCEQFTCSQPNISRHLAVLTNAGLVSKDKRGSFVLYSVTNPRVFDFCDLVCRHVDQQIERYNG